MKFKFNLLEGYGVHTGDLGCGDLGCGLYARGQ